MLRKKIVSKQMSLCQQQDFMMKKRLLQRQLKFMNNLLEDNPKEYHVWTYKKDLLSSILKDQRKTQQSSRTQFTQQIYLSENKFIFSLLIEDCRNYHAWDYRFWLVTFLNKIQDELKWIDQLITNNCGLDPLIQETIKGIQKSGQLTVKEMKINWMEVNSLWSHKFNLIKYIRQHQNEPSKEILEMYQNEQQHKKHEQNNQSSSINTLIQKQLTQSITLLRFNRKNQPLWNYLSGLIKMIQHSKQLNNLYNQHIKQQLKLLFDQTQIKILQIKHMNRFQLSFLKRHVDLFGLKEKQCQVLNQKILLRLKQIDSTREKYYDYLIQTKNGNKL